MSANLFGISATARKVGRSEETVRRLADQGVVKVDRDSAGRRLFTEQQITQLREHLAGNRRTA